MRIGGVLIVDQWSYREVARRFYPGEPSLQRKWLRAHRRAPGPRCSIGTRCEEELRERCLADAIAYLRTTRRGYAGDVLGRPAPIKGTPPPSRLTAVK